MCYVRAKQRLRRACDVRACEAFMGLASCDRNFAPRGADYAPPPIFLDDLVSLLWDDQFSLFNYLLMIMYVIGK